MVMNFLFNLKILPEEEKVEQILLILAVLGILLLIGIALEIFEKKYTKEYGCVKKFLNKFNIFNKSETKKDV